MAGKTRKADARREEILRAAGACFKEKGLRGASISDICTRLKISPGHLYYYFKSKEAIVEALLDQMREALMLDLERELAAAEGVVQFFMSGDYMGPAEMPEGVYLDEITVWELYAEAARHPQGRVSQLVHEQWRTADAILANRIKASKAMGEIRADADIELIRTLMGMAIVTAQMARFGDPDFQRERYLAATRHVLTPFIETAARRGKGRS